MPTCVSVPVPLMAALIATASDRSKTRMALFTTAPVPSVPLVPPLPICRVPPLIVVPPL